MTKGGLQVGGNYRGLWDSDTEYARNDIVTSGGVLYAAKVDHVSGSAFVSSLWTALSAGGGGGSSAPTIVGAGNLGASRTETVADGAQEWLIGTLNANHALTANLGAGSALKLLFTQDATGGRTLTVNGQALTVPSSPGATIEVDLVSDGTDTYITVVGPGPMGPAGTNGTNGTNGINGAISVIEDEGTPLTVRSNINFVGAGVSAADTGGKTLVTIPGGGGGGTTLDACRVFSSAATSLVNNTDTPVAFDSERYDTAAFHDNATNNTRLTAPAHGIFNVGAAVEFASNATGHRILGLRLNGTTVIARDDRMTVTTTATRVVVATQYELAAGDYIEVMAFQNSGATITITVAANFSPEAWMSLVRTMP